MIWRGPMVMSALTQMLREVDWGTLDVMVVDMPPGTGDAQLTMAQQVALAGAVIVSTPQDIALIDARKGLKMFEKVGIPILGIVENMSLHICSHCGHEERISVRAAARRWAATMAWSFSGPCLSTSRSANRPTRVCRRWLPIPMAASPRSTNRSRGASR